MLHTHVCICLVVIHALSLSSGTYDVFVSKDGTEPKLVRDSTTLLIGNVQLSLCQHMCM